MIGVEFVVGKNYEVLVKGARFEVPLIAILAWFLLRWGGTSGVTETD